jgi:NAD(P) transhydrogenase
MRVNDCKLLVVLLGAALVALECHAFSPAVRSLARPKTISLKSPLSATTLEPDVTAAVFEQEENRILGQPIPYDELTIGVMKETFKGENRVSQTPDSVKMLIKEGFNVVVQAGGKNSFGCD